MLPSRRNPAKSARGSCQNQSSRSFALPLVDECADLFEDLRPRRPRRLEPPLQGVGGQGLRGPAHREPQVERAALVRPPLVVVRRAVVRGDGHEVRRLLDRRLPLRQSDVGAADHADLAVRPRLRRRPLHRVVAVRRLLPHGVELALRAVAPARVLVEGRVASLCEVAPGARIAVAAGAGRPPVVRRPLQDHGKRPVTRRQVHLGREPDPVPHRRPLDLAAHAFRITVLPLTRGPRRGRSGPREDKPRRRGENHAVDHALLPHRCLPWDSNRHELPTAPGRSPFSTVSCAWRVAR